MWFQANAGISVWESRLSLTLSQLPGSQVEDLKSRYGYNHAAQEISRDARLAAAWKQEWELTGPSRMHRYIREPADGATGGDDPPCRQRTTEALANRGRSLWYIIADSAATLNRPSLTPAPYTDTLGGRPLRPGSRDAGLAPRPQVEPVTLHERRRTGVTPVWSRAGLFQITPSFCCCRTCRLSGEDDPPPVRLQIKLRWELLWAFWIYLQLEVLLKKWLTLLKHEIFYLSNKKNPIKVIFKETRLCF